MNCTTCNDTKVIESDGTMVDCPDCTITITEPAKEQKEAEKLLECEICSNKVKTLEKIKTINMCPDCKAKELIAHEQIEKDAEQRIVESDPRYKFHIQVDTDLGNLPGSDFEKALQIKARIDEWGNTLFEAQTKRNRYYQTFIELAKELRAEERLRLGLTGDYKPYSPKGVEPKPRAPRQTKEDKSINFMVNTFFGKKLLKLDEVNKESFKDHPEWWSNGILKPEFIKVHEDYIDSRGAVTLKMAEERVKTMVSSARAKNMTEIAEGKRKLSE